MKTANICEKTITTINFPISLLKQIDAFVSESLFSNRSEAVRFLIQIGIMEFIKHKNIDIKKRINLIKEKHNNPFYYKFYDKREKEIYFISKKIIENNKKEKVKEVKKIG